MKTRSLIIAAIVILVMVSPPIYSHGTETYSSDNSTTSTIHFGEDETFILLQIDAYNWYFQSNDPLIKKGSKVRLLFTVKSGHHGISIPGLGIKTGNLTKNQSVTIDFIAEKSGSFSYYCNIPCGKGHADMKGVLIVK